jgi:hypothetical protein
MSYSPIAGNEGFSRLDQFTGSLPSLNETDGLIDDLKVSEDLFVGKIQTSGKGQFVTRFAYAPSGFSTLVSGGTLSLMTKPGLPNATSLSNPNLFLLPTGAVVTGAVLTNNGVTVSGSGSTVSVGSGAVLNGAVVTPITSGTTIALLNSGAVVGYGQAAVLTGANLIGAAGVAPGVGFNAVTVSGTLVNVSCAVGNLTTGDLSVQITYYNPTL